jgi:hypothetical protein
MRNALYDACQDIHVNTIKRQHNVDGFTRAGSVQRHLPEHFVQNVTTGRTRLLFRAFSQAFKQQFRGRPSDSKGTWSGCTPAASRSSIAKHSAAGRVAAQTNQFLMTFTVSSTSPS